MQLDTEDGETFVPPAGVVASPTMEQPLRVAEFDALFAVNARPHKGTRGDYRVKLRHGVSTVRSGRRHTLGIIFHDAA